MTIMKNRIYAHRGLWGKAGKNSLDALLFAANSGYAIETDIRDFKNSIVISHDPVIDNPELNLSQLVGMNSKFALNIKSDGLLPLIPDMLNQNFDYFFFDGSIPELYKYRHAGFNTAVRISEFERDLPWASSRIWLDSFETDWWLTGAILERYSEKSEVIVVSPELHGRDKSKVWEFVHTQMQQGNTNVSICTDFPVEFEGIL
jgi:glycerophosphoryl diester phosphodiesterase